MAFWTFPAALSACPLPAVRVARQLAGFLGGTLGLFGGAFDTILVHRYLLMGRGRARSENCGRAPRAFTNHQIAAPQAATFAPSSQTEPMTVEPTYDAIRAARPSGSPPKIVIPPKAPSIPDKGDPHGGSERKRHAAEIARTARDHWSKPHSPGSRRSTTGASPPEPSAPGRTRSPFTSRSPTETC
jgi:hypothetical protein